jgi:hypothetical protein
MGSSEGTAQHHEAFLQNTFLILSIVLALTSEGRWVPVLVRLWGTRHFGMLE